MSKLLSDRAKMFPLLAVAVLIALGSTLVIVLTNRSTPGSPGGASSPGVSTTTGGAGGAAGAVKLRISNYAFEPKTTTVRAGTTVAWTNQDGTPHTATASGPSFDTGTINAGRSGSFTFKKPGTYQYICSFHAFMHGTIIVR